jgi:ABC-type multidrug transport system ATPase subunit
MVVQSIEITDISVRFKDEQVLNRISFVLKSGNITALIGPNGAGKSTCMKVLAGLVYPQSGSFSINNSSSNNVFSDLRKYGGFLIESPAFYSYMSAHQNLKLLQKIRPLKRPVEELLKLVGLENTSSKKLAHFSKGMKQRLGIAQALIGDPDFLVLDEPFHGLDIEVKEELMEIIEKLAKEEGKSILISSHLLSDLGKNSRRLCAS